MNGVPANTSTPQPQDRNVTQNGQNQAKNKTSPPALVESIKGVWLAGKSISCMHLDRPGRQGKFCLVEAVCKLYFNGCSVNEFLYALENVLKVPLVTCTDEEEKSFIHYYSLPVSVLKCNKMINYKDLDEYFPQLSYVFREKTGSNGESQSQTSNSNKTNSAKGEDLSRKRHLSANSGPIGKQPCRRLEATVQRLMSQQESQIIGKLKLVTIDLSFLYFTIFPSQKYNFHSIDYKIRVLENIANFDYMFSTQKGGKTAI